MAHETFENKVAAELINKYFVPIKVDREEFPDVDKRYQFYLQATGKRGGWPLTVFALPDGRPFFGGTYFPPKPAHGLPAFAEVTAQIARLYEDKPEEARKFADNYEKFTEKFYAVEKSFEDLQDFDFHGESEHFSKMFDAQNGGLGQGAKFPNVPVLIAMMDYYDTDLYVRDFMKLTADKLCTTGIYDHVNGGFFRYAVDRDWTVPHFEKMLYDNALNTVFLLEMYEKTENMLYFRIAEKTVDFILHEFMTDFGLIAAMDADSMADNGKLVEGYYYLLDELYIEPFKENVILNEGVITFNEADYESYMKAEQYLDGIRDTNTREKPAKDTKVIMSQNMLFCKTLLKMTEISGKDYYMEQATALLNKMRHFLTDGRTVFRINYDGDVMPHSTLEDYVFTIDTYLEFFEITKEKHFLTEAAAFAEQATSLFTENGVIYLDEDKTVSDTFDDSMPNAAGVFVDLLINRGENMGLPVEKSMLDFAADRLIKYAGGHPTLFKTFKRYCGK